MNVWVAKATLTCTLGGEWVYEFRFYSEEGEYDINLTKKEYMSNKTFVDFIGLPYKIRIPVIPKIKKSDRQYTIEQGFNYELNETQLNHVENDFKFYLSKYIMEEQQKYEENYKKKINAIGLFHEEE